MKEQQQTDEDSMHELLLMFVRLRIMFSEHSVCIKLEMNNNKNNGGLSRSITNLRLPT
jgi:hypothetical protein